MNQKKIAILLNTSWYIYNFRQNLIKKLIENGYQIHTIAPIDDYSEKLKELGCEYHSIEMDSKSKNPLSDIQLLIRIYKILLEIKPAVLINFTIKPNVYGSIAANQLNIPSINNVAGMGTLFSDGFFSRAIFKTLFRISQKNAHTVFFQNPDDFEELTKNNVVNRNIARLLPGSGVNLKDFPYTPAKRKDNNQIEFLLLARMIYSKGIVELVEAGRLLYEKGYRNFHITLLGETGINNPQAIPVEELNQICTPPFVAYLGKTDDVKSFIKNADVVVLPSFYREGTPKSLLEALGVARPIITTKMPGCKETVIDGENGFLCEPQSVEDLADKMEQFINLDFEKRLAMGVRSRKLAEEKYDEKIVIDSYLETIKNVKKMGSSEKKKK
jgi:glycosyltransferase involved in cell wall biosynthesis